MKQLLLVHPVGQATAFLFGIFNMVSGVTKKWFHVAIHINCGMLFYGLLIIGTVVGAGVSKWAEGNNIVLHTGIHKFVSFIVILLIASGATSGFMIMRKMRGWQTLKTYHCIINACCLVFLVVQGIIGVIVLIAAYR